LIIPFDVEADQGAAMSGFFDLLEQEIPRLRRYARALTRDRVRADDLVQETLLRAIRKEHLWEPGTDLRAWLFTIMHNQNVNEVRLATRDAASLDVQDCSTNLIANSDPSASCQLQDLEHTLSQLPERQRQIILLVGLEGMMYEDVAGILQIPVGTVRSRLSRGREVLRKLMGMDPKPANTTEFVGPRRMRPRNRERQAA
jgi:RNA polymerase sigma-70 factor, ECF subfamily